MLYHLFLSDMRIFQLYTKLVIDLCPNYNFGDNILLTIRASYCSRNTPLIRVFSSSPLNANERCRNRCELACTGPLHRIQFFPAGE